MISIPFNRRSFKERHLFLFVMLVFIGMSHISTFSCINDFSITNEPDKEISFKPVKERRLAIASFLDSSEQMYGIFSIHNQIAKYNMTSKVSQVVVVPNSMIKKNKDVLIKWIGKENVRSVDKSYIHNRIIDEGIWKKVFNKMWLFNLTDFDKIIMMDSDILIRRNIMHWFDYPSPCGIQAKDDLAWNSGALIVEPNTRLFDKMINTLPLVKEWDVKAARAGEYPTTDSFNSGFGQQAFLYAFFTNITDKNAPHRCVLPTEAAALSTSIVGSPLFQYYNRFRKHIFETVHLTAHKPWQSKARIHHPFMCELLREWKESVANITEYGIGEIQNNYLRDCPSITV